METDEASKAPEAGSAPTAAEPSTTPAPAAAIPEESEEVKTHRSRLADVKRILAGSLPIALHLEFLYSHNHADLQVQIDHRNLAFMWSIHCSSSLSQRVREGSMQIGDGP